jgi:fructose/tagatose bisphosphate aldolase
MFADMKQMVAKAWREQYALLAINCMNLESARAAVRMAEKYRAPIILNLYQGICRISRQQWRWRWPERWPKRPAFPSR